MLVPKWPITALGGRHAAKLSESFGIHRIIFLLSLAVGQWMLGTRAACALDILWNGSGLGGDPSSWHDSRNWDPAGSPISVQRVPGDGDTATLTAPLSDLVFLRGDSAPIDGLVVSNDIRLVTNGYRLQVDNGGFAGIATTFIRFDASIDVHEYSIGTAFVTDNLVVSDGGNLVLFGGDAIVEGNTSVLDGGTISTALQAEANTSEIIFGGDVLLQNGNLLFPNRANALFSGGNRVRFEDDSSIELNQDLEIDNNVLVTVKDGSDLRVRGKTTIGPTGSLDLAPHGPSDYGSFFGDGDVLVDGGLLAAQGNSAFRVESDHDFEATNHAQVRFESGLRVDRYVMRYLDGADVQIDGGIQLGLSVSGSQGAIEVDGEGTTLTAGTVLMQSSPAASFESLFRLANSAEASIGQLTLGNSFSSNNIVEVHSNGLLTVDGAIHIGISGDNALRECLISVSSGGRLIQTGDATSQIGHAEGVTGKLVVDDGGVFASNDQSVLIDATGTLEVAGGAAAGRVDIRGPLTNKGTILVRSDGGPVNPGGQLRLRRPTTIDGGTLTIDGGEVLADSITFANSGQFALNSGKLSARIFDDDLPNLNGEIAPGPVDAPSGPGSMTILGDYTQQSGAKLSLEIGGDVMATQYDFLDVTGQALLGGELQLALIDGFRPSSFDTFLAVNAEDIFGSFANVGNGGRLETLGGLGSFQVNYGIGSSFDPDQVVLSDFQSQSADVDGDGEVDGNDFLLIQRADPSLLPLWESQFAQPQGARQPAAVTLPEPSGIYLALIGCGASLSISYKPRQARRILRRP